MSDSRTIGTCVYCQQHREISSDHVPPKVLFPEPRPSDLITVPSCDACNGATSMDEQYLALLLNFGVAGDTREGQRLKQKFARTYSRGPRLHQRMAEATRIVYERCADGVRPRRAIATEMGRIDRVIAKIVRGLFYFEFQRPLLQADDELVTIFKDARKPWPLTLKYSVQPGRRTWPGVFQYSIGPINSQSSQTIRQNAYACYMTFYETQEAVGIWADNPARDTNNAYVGGWPTHS